MSKNRFEDRVIRPGGKMFNIYAKTQVEKTFKRVRAEIASAKAKDERDEAERREKVAPMAARKKA